MRRSSVVLSDDEIAAQIRAEHVGHPEEWVTEKVEQELAESADVQRWAQAAYDQSPPHRRFASTQD